jgi:hypothetical protein
MNPELSSKFMLSDHKTVTVFENAFTAKAHCAPVHGSIATKTLGSKMAIAESAPVLLNQKKTVLQNRTIH